MGPFAQAKATVRSLVRAPIAQTIRWRERRVGSFRHELAVCAIFREEAPFLHEWIEFHVGVGATHFYLYNNFSTDDFRDVLEPWRAQGYVTLVDWPVSVGQLPAYRDVLKRARRECRWLALIDIDEFLFSPQTEDIRPILARYRDLPAVEVWQVFFGSGGHQAKPALPVTEAYRKRAPLSRTTTKSIVNPRLVYKVGVHQCKYWAGKSSDTARQIVSNDRTAILEPLRINHYWSRSIEDLTTKVRRGDPSTSMPRNKDWHFEFERTLNAESDDTIVPIARRIRGQQQAGKVTLSA